MIFPGFGGHECRLKVLLGDMYSAASCYECHKCQHIKNLPKKRNQSQLARLPKIVLGHFSYYLNIFVDFLDILVWNRVWNLFFSIVHLDLLDFGMVWERFLVNFSHILWTIPILGKLWCELGAILTSISTWDVRTLWKAVAKIWFNAKLRLKIWICSGAPYCRDTTKVDIY